jgi:hypothetical protein
MNYVYVSLIYNILSLEDVHMLTTRHIMRERIINDLYRKVNNEENA